MGAYVYNANSFNPVILKNLRMSSSLTQSGLADITGIRQKTISVIEAGKSSPTVSTLEAIAEGLGLKLELSFESILPPQENCYSVNGRFVGTANLILDYRFRHNLSQKELALKAGINQSSLSRIENGIVSPRICTLCAIGKIEIRFVDKTMTNIIN